MISARTSNVFSFRSLSLGFAVAAAFIVSTPVIADAVYEPVKSSDTLSKIINRTYTGPKASKMAMMRRIVVENPQAFLYSEFDSYKKALYFYSLFLNATYKTQT